MFGDLGKMMKMVGDVKRRMPEIKAKLESSEFSASSGGGAVTATVNGKLKIIAIKLDPKLTADGKLDVEMLEDMLKAAISAAQVKASDAAAEAMKELTGGMSIPGMDEML